jgi:hypothetical protein
MCCWVGGCSLFGHVESACPHSVCFSYSLAFGGCRAKAVLNLCLAIRERAVGRAELRYGSMLDVSHGV